MIKAREKNPRYIQEISERLIELSRENYKMGREDIDDALTHAQIYLLNFNNTEIESLDVEIDLLKVEFGVKVTWFNDNRDAVRERRFIQWEG